MARANDEDTTAAEDRLTLNIATALCVATSVMMVAMAIARPAPTDCKLSSNDVDSYYRELK
jgi:hypothetical protein